MRLNLHLLPSEVKQKSNAFGFTSWSDPQIKYKSEKPAENHTLNKARTYSINNYLHALLGSNDFTASS